MNLEQIAEYRTLLDTDSVSLADIGKWLDSFRPTKLYRYMRFDSYRKQNVFEGQFFLAPAENINDPFDCLAYIDHNKYTDYIIQEVRHLLPGIDEQLIISTTQETIEDDLDRGLIKIRKEFRLGCLSETPLSTLMWAHYTDNHSGFCIEYDLSRIDPGYRHGILPVIYSDERYDATKAFIKRDRNLLMNLYLFKSSCWKYEKEWRMVIPQNIITDGEYYADFLSAISAIYLGIKSSEEHSEEIREICDLYKERQIPVYQMDIEHKSYQLKPVQIK